MVVPGRVHLFKSIYKITTSLSFFHQRRSLSKPRADKKSCVVKSKHAGQRLAFQQFQARATSSGDVAHLVSMANLLYGCNRVTTSYDRRNALAAQVSQLLRNCLFSNVTYVLSQLCFVISVLWNLMQ